MRAPIMADESVFTLQDAWQLSIHRAADILESRRFTLRIVRLFTENYLPLGDYQVPNTPQPPKPRSKDRSGANRC